jgi:hypothetical protein
MPHRLSELGLFLATMLFLPLVAQGQELALRGATVHTAAGQPVENATILIRDGRIAAVGGTLCQPLLDVAVAERKAVIQPDRIADKLSQEAVPVEMAGAVRHGTAGGGSGRGRDSSLQPG